MASIFHPRYPTGKQSPYWNLRCYDRQTGKPHYLPLKYPDGRRIKNRRDAEYYRAKHELVCSRRGAPNGRLTFAVAIEHYLAEIRAEQRLSTRALYDVEMRSARLTTYLATARVDQLTPPQLQDVLVRLMDEHAIGPVTRNNYRKLLRHFAAWCRFRGYVLEDFTEGIPKLKEPTRTKVVVTRARWPELLAHAATTPLSLFVPLGLYTGFRRGTLLALDVADWNRQTDRISTRAEIMKDGTPLRMPVHTELKPWLVRYAPASGRLCPGLTPRAVDYWMKRFLDRMKLPGTGRGSHALRRSFTRALLDRLPAGRVRDALGHASLRTTDGYTEPVTLTPDELNTI